MWKSACRKCIHQMAAQVQDSSKVPSAQAFIRKQSAAVAATHSLD